MSEVLIATYYVREKYAATVEQEESGDSRIDKNGDIEYTCRYYVVKKGNEYLVKDPAFTCASYTNLDKLIEDMGLRNANVSWKSPELRAKYG